MPFPPSRIPMISVCQSGGFGAELKQPHKNIIKYMWHTQRLNIDEVHRKISENSLGFRKYYIDSKPNTVGQFSQVSKYIQFHLSPSVSGVLLSMTSSSNFHALYQWMLFLFFVMRKHEVSFKAQRGISAHELHTLDSRWFIRFDKVLYRIAISAFRICSVSYRNCY